MDNLLMTILGENQKEKSVGGYRREKKLGGKKKKNVLTDDKTLLLSCKLQQTDRLQWVNIEGMSILNHFVRLVTN